MATTRTYNVPLRREFGKVQKYKRAKRALTALKTFLSKHMKSDNVKIGQTLNREVWKNGIKNPPHHIQVDVTKEDDGTVKAELKGVKFTEAKKVKKEEKGALGEAAEKLKAKLGPKEKKEKAIEDKIEKIKEEKAEKAKEVEKEELKELKEEVKKEKAPPKEARGKEQDLAKKAPRGGQKMSADRRGKQVQ
jgi:large subunit ribosomal protein L31e